MRGSRVQFPPSAPYLPRMIEESLRSKPSRSRRREAFRRRVTMAVGGAAIVILISALALVIHRQMGKTSSKPDQVQNLGSQAKLAMGKRAGLEEIKDVSPLAGRNADALDSNSTVSGIENMRLKRRRIADVAKSYFAAKTMEEKLKHVRDPDRVGPLMKKAYQRDALNPIHLRDLGWAVPIDEPGYRLGVVEALFEDAQPLQVVVEELESGQFRIDWESLVRHGDIAWMQFLSGKPTEPALLRLVATRLEPGHTVEDGNKDGGIWIELRHPSEAGALMGYLDGRAPHFAGLLEQLVAGNWKNVPVTLRLCFPEPASLRMGDRVQIVGVEGRGWLMIPTKSNG